MILKGTIGVVVTFTVKRDGVPLPIGGASTKNLLLKPPRGSTKTFAASFVTDGSDGKLKYTTASVNDLDQAGLWQVAASIVMTGWTGQTEADELVVTDTL